MIIWCAYCQHFLKEAAPFEDLAVSHGMCTDCSIKGLSKNKFDDKKLRQLVDLQRDLYSAGHSGDISRIEPLIQLSRKIGVRPIDMIFGFLNPMLIRIGELWSEGKITIEDENRFTGFCLKLLEALQSGRPINKERPLFLLASADGNNHNFGLQLLQLWLEAQDYTVELISPTLKDQLLEYTLKVKTQFIGISVSLPEQGPSVKSFIKDLISKTQAPVQQIFVGGYAIKTGLLNSKELAPAILIKDVKDLAHFLSQNKS